MRAGQKSKLITHILSCITSVICFLLLHFSVQCYLLQLNPIIFQENLKKRLQLLIQIMLITSAAPHPNDPNVYGDWTNGGNTMGDVVPTSTVTQVKAIITMVITEKGILISAFIDR